LALSTTTAIAIVRYAIPAWRNRRFIENRWLSWTGPSRTGIESGFSNLCGPTENWYKIATHISTRDSQIPSDRWGLAISPPAGLAQDPTDLLLAIPNNSRAALIWAVMTGRWGRAFMTTASTGAACHCCGASNRASALVYRAR
jgi:hypothetical protein